MPDFFNTQDALNMPGVLTNAEVESGYMPPQPRIHREIGSGLALSTSWQRVDLSIPLSNSFPSLGANKMVDWNAASKLFTFNDTTTRNYSATLNISLSSTGILLTPVVIPIKVNFRFVVPNGNGAGSDYYFPFSSTDGYMDLQEISWNGKRNIQKTTPITSDTMKRTNGVGCELKLSSNPLTGGIVASYFSVYMFGA